MAATENHLSVTKTARYFSLGELSESTKNVWIVCHGYGQLADYFLRNFNILDAPGNYIVAPEGFHRFYLNGFSGRVGASWMTKEDRLSDIKDYVNFLDNIYEAIFEKIDRVSVTVGALGFSQGGATASRWVCMGTSKIDNLVLWASVFPPDMNFEVDKNTLNHLNFTLAAGDKDEFMNEQDIARQCEMLDEQGIRYRLFRFPGGHKINPELLQKLGVGTGH